MRRNKFYVFLLVILCSFMVVLTGCASGSSSKTSTHHTLSTTNGSIITYGTSPQDVLIRTFYGGGRLGTLELSPGISIYGDGTYIFGPELQMREGQLQDEVRQQMLAMFGSLELSYSSVPLHKGPIPSPTPTP
jgi:hypothetical protein